MESLLGQAKGQYDLVVIDTPPLTAVSDAFPLLRKGDGPPSGRDTPHLHDAAPVSRTVERPHVPRIAGLLGSRRAARDQFSPGLWPVCLVSVSAGGEATA
jgi:hypothetical protein